MKDLVASVVLVLALTLIGCSGGLAAAPSPSPSPAIALISSPAAVAGASLNTSQPGVGPQGVLVDMLSEPGRYMASLVALDGSVTRRIIATKRTPIATPAGHAVDLPYVNTSLSTLYFLDGDSSVRALKSDGTMAEVARLPVGAKQVATFAVSPENNRIAVGVLDFSRTPVHVTLSTDALRGGERKVIFESDTNYVWPVAWHLSRLVLAHAYGPYRESITAAGPGQANPYSAVSYHIVDASDASRIALLGQCTVSGPLSPAGTACIQGGTLGWEGGEGRNWGTQNWGSISAYGSLSPTGEFVAAAMPPDETRLGFWRADGTLATWVESPNRPYWAGWLDATHVLLPAVTGGGSRIVQLSTGPSPTITVAASGDFAATLPTAVS